MEAVYLHNSYADYQRKGNQVSCAFSRFYGGSSSSHSNSYSSPSVNHNPNHRHHQQNQPPLLPLPIAKPYQNDSTTYNHQSLSVRKSNSSIVNRGRQKPNYKSSTSLNNQIGPHPNDVPRAMFLCNKITKFSGSVVSTVLSPPPTSLPLPTFSLRPKFSCNTQATAGIDARATDNLQRILRLR